MKPPRQTKYLPERGYQPTVLTQEVSVATVIRWMLSLKQDGNCIRSIHVILT